MDDDDDWRQVLPSNSLPLDRLCISSPDFAPDFFLDDDASFEVENKDDDEPLMWHSEAQTKAFETSNDYVDMKFLSCAETEPVFLEEPCVLQPQLPPLPSALETTSSSSSVVAELRHQSSSLARRVDDNNNGPTKHLSLHAKTIQQSNDVHNRFGKLLPFLKQNAPIKNEHNLFDDLEQFVDASIVHFASSFDVVRVCKTTPKWPQLLQMVPYGQQFVWTRVAVSRTRNRHDMQTYDVYVDRHNQHVFLVQFVNARHEFDTSFASTDTTDIVRESMQIPHSVRVECLSIPLVALAAPAKATRHKATLLGAKRARGGVKNKHREQLSVECENKMWSLVFLFLVNNLRQSPDGCFFELFMREPAICPMLLQASVQSILYFLAEHDELLESWLRKSPDDANDECSHKNANGCTLSCAIVDIASIPDERKHQFAKSLFAQTNQKSLLAMRKQSANHIGKFKGRQRDKLLCITINQTIGVQLTFDQLFSTSIFALLANASKLPRQTEISYNDLVEHLAFAFPVGFDGLFGRHVCVKTPYMQTCDPVRMFGPIASMLWPDLTTIEALVEDHLKTYKMEFEMSSVQDMSQIDSFVHALQLGPNKPYEDLEHCVSLLDSELSPLGIFYVDETKSPSKARDKFLQHIGSGANDVDVEVRLLSGGDVADIAHNVMTHFVVSAQQRQVVGAPTKVSWKGSRTSGFAVRRTYKDGRMMIRTFASMNDFVQREQKHAVKVKLNERLFARLNAAQVLITPAVLDVSAQLVSFEQLKRNLKGVNFINTLVVVEDIGKPRFYCVGNLSRDTSPKFKCCRSCALDFTSGGEEDDVNVKWFAELTKNHRATTELQGTSSVAPHHFMMAVDGRNPRFCASAEQLTLRQHVTESFNMSTFRTAYVGAIQNPNVRYVNTWKELYAAVLQGAIHNSMLQKCTLQPLDINRTLTQFKGAMPRGCECCTTPFCKVRLAALVLILDIFADVRSMSTTIPSLYGCNLESTAFKLNVGLRCAHDWTNGTGDVFFKGTFCDSPTPLSELVVKASCDASHLIVSTFEEAAQAPCVRDDGPRTLFLTFN